MRHIIGFFHFWYDFLIGDSWQIGAGVPHDAKASADKSLKVLAVYVVDKSKPLATPAPEK